MSASNQVSTGTPIEGFVKVATGFLSGKVCSYSPDSYHHSDTKGGFGHSSGGTDDNGRFTWLTCKYCNEQFKFYTSGGFDPGSGGGFSKSDLQQSYETQVAILPAPTITSAGKLIWQPTFLDLQSYSCYYITSASYTSLPYEFNSSDYRYSFMADESVNAVRVSWFNKSSFSQKRNYGGIRYKIYVPISGYYKALSSLRCVCRTVDLDGNIVEKTYDYPVDTRFYHHDMYNSSGGKDWFYSPGNDTVSFCLTTGYLSQSSIWYFPTYEIIPDTAIEPGSTSSGDTYNINSRPTSITGDYGIIGDNGQIIKVEGDKIVNETNNTIYNPATGETHTMSDWSYNYEDRSYTVTTETGDTITITYGDENVTIKEGDTTYNIYYLVGGSGSENPGPDVSTPCNHQWTETGTTPATCTVPGSRTLTCSLCNQTKTETVPAPGHKWIIRQEVKNEYDSSGNQTQEGYTIWECSVCGEQQKTTDGTAPPGGGSGTGSGSSGGVFSGIFGLLVDFLSFFWNTFRDFVGEGVKGFLAALMDGTSSIFGLLNPFNWGG